MICNVVFSLEAVAELVRIAGVVRPASAVIQAAGLIRRMLENDPREVGSALPEGLYFVDREPLRAFFIVDDDARLVEITDFRILCQLITSITGPAKIRFPFIAAAPFNYRHIGLILNDFLYCGNERECGDSAFPGRNLGTRGIAITMKCKSIARHKITGVL